MDENNYLEDYEVNQETLALCPHFHPEYQTKVLETSGVYYVKGKPLDLLKRNCKQFGASLRGRQEWAAYVMNKSYKLPILVQEHHNLLAFPTHSPRHTACTWIFVNQFPDIKTAAQKQKSLVQFPNGTELTVDVSYPSLNRQMQQGFACLGYFLGRRFRFFRPE
ncbi:competence protein ComK [Halalkalibacterium ligniniphilum]|uniref:competence protein ComK n=1 Tax=Halalkalibacterium ligniniphilum TaxID=1134413 RepID=UPI000344B0C5|nr:competence protein ComK [Halalkalibacterium ligniniphilum]